MGWAQNSAGLGMFGSPRSPAAPWYGYSHDLDADEPSPRASRSHTHSPAGDPTLELEIATSFNTVLNKMRRLEADLGRPLRSPKHSPGKSQSPTSDARMKRMEKMERRLTWVLENGAAQPVGGGASESDPAASPARPPAGDEPMPEASRTLARRSSAPHDGEGRGPRGARGGASRAGEIRARGRVREVARRDRRLASENAELRGAVDAYTTVDARRATGASPAARQREEENVHEMRRLKDDLDASLTRAADRLEQASASDASVAADGSRRSTSGSGRGLGGTGSRRRRRRWTGSRRRRRGSGTTSKRSPNGSSRGDEGRIPEATAGGSVRFVVARVRSGV